MALETKDENLIAQKSFDFSVRIVRLYDYLVERRTNYGMGDQILRSGTSIGANISEATQAQTHADFISKMSIAHKECAETLYWIRLLKATNRITRVSADSLLKDCDELFRILTSILKTAKQNAQKK